MKSTQFLWHTIFMSKVMPDGIGMMLIMSFTTDSDEMSLQPALVVHMWRCSLMFWQGTESVRLSDLCFPVLKQFQTTKKTKKNKLTILSMYIMYNKTIINISNLDTCYCLYNKTIINVSNLLVSALRKQKCPATPREEIMQILYWIQIWMSFILYAGASPCITCLFIMQKVFVAACVFGNASFDIKLISIEVEMLGH